MGLRAQYIGFIFDALSKVFKTEDYEHSILELGNQIARLDLTPQYRTGKDFWTAHGWSHTSIDINGKDGALPLDLTKHIYRGFNKKFTLVTDIGVSCCVSDKSPCFDNIYGLCVKDGIIVHILPAVGSRWSATIVPLESLMEMIRKRNGQPFLFELLSEEHGGLYAIASRKM